MFRAALLGSFVLLVVPSAASAANKTFTGPLNGGAWNVGTNWTPAGIPTSGDTVYLGGTSEGRDVTLAGAGATVARVYGGGRLIIDGVALKVTGAADVTSFEDAEVINGGSVEIAGPGAYQGGITLGGPGTGSVSVTGAGVRWSGAVLEGAAGSGSVTIAPGADVKVEAFTVLSITGRFQNRGALSTDVLTEIIPSPGSPTSDGTFTATASGTISVRPGAGPALTPTPTPSAPPRPRLTAADLVWLPSSRRCVTRVRVRLLRPAGVTVALATAAVSGKRPKRLERTVDLRGPRGAFTVKVAVRLADGRSFSVSRRYRTCAPSRRSDSSHRRSALSASSA